MKLYYVLIKSISFILRGWKSIESVPIEFLHYLLLVAFISMFLVPKITVASYEEGLLAYTEGRYKDAFRELSIDAKKGHKLAQTYLGFLYLNGQGVEKDSKEGFKWSLSAAKQGVADAQKVVGLFYLRDSVVEKDITKALFWLKKAAESGEAEHQHFYALVFDSSDLVPINYYNAAYWYEKAAMQGYVVSASILGQLYFTGDGNEYDDGNFNQSYLNAYVWLRIGHLLGGRPFKNETNKCKTYFSVEEQIAADLLISEKLEVIKSNIYKNGIRYELQNNNWVPVVIEREDNSE